MTAKEYLRQALILDLRINSKIEQLENLKQLVLNLGGCNDGMPRSTSKSGGFSNTIDKIVDLQADINREIDSLVDLKKKISEAIEEVEDKECKLLLELRYLNYKNWEQIATDMHYGIRNVHYLHGEALKKVNVP